MLLALHSDATAIHHRCDTCGGERHIPIVHLVVTSHTISTPPCHCGTGTHSVESFRRNIPDHEVGIGTHPGSLVGMVFPDTGGIVMEHTHGYSLDGATVAQKQLARELERVATSHLVDSN